MAQMVPFERVRELRDKIAAGEPVGLSVDELILILNMALALDGATSLLSQVANGPGKIVALRLIPEWLKQLHDPETPEAPCKVNAPGPGPQTTSHKEEATPASVQSFSDAPPGKTKDQARLPAQPAGVPLSRDERKCAEKMADAAERFVDTFKDHLDVCAPCNINWSSLRKALGQWQSVTK